MKNWFYWRLPSLSYNVLPMTPGLFVLIAASSDASESWETTQVVRSLSTSWPRAKRFLVQPDLTFSIRILSYDLRSLFLLFFQSRSTRDCKISSGPASAIVCGPQTGISGARVEPAWSRTGCMMTSRSYYINHRIRNLSFHLFYFLAF